jgi:hypothetical protein
MPSRQKIQRFYDENDEFRRIIDNAKRAALPKASEGPTEAQQKARDFLWDVLDRDGDGNIIQKRARAAVSSRLDWYLSRGSITEAMHRAGEIISLLMFCSGKVPRVCVMFRERTQQSQGSYERWINEKSQSQQDLEAALAVLDARERDALWDVCALDNYANNVQALRTGLRALVVHFGSRCFL